MKRFFVFLYVWAFASMFALHKAFILSLDPLAGQLLAIINAAVLAKVIVLLEIFHIGEYFPNHAAIFRILTKSLMFGLLLLLFRVVEEGLRGWFHGETLSESIDKITGGRILEMLTLAIMMVVALVPYFVTREVCRGNWGEEVVGGYLREAGEGVSDANSLSLRLLTKAATLQS